MSKKLIWWLFILGIMALAGWWLLFKKELPPPPNHYAEFLTSLKEMGWQHPDANKPGSCSVSGISTDEKLSSPSAAECELRNLQGENEIAGTVNDLQNVKPKGNLAMLLMFVPSDRREWLEKDLTNFAGVSSLGDIEAKRDTLRKLFDAFQTVANSSNALETQCRLDSSKFPYLALACRVSEDAKKTTTQPLQKPEWNTLPFFSKNDVLRVQSLSNVVGVAGNAPVVGLKVIESKPDATVLDKLCLLAKEKGVIQSSIADEMKEAKVDDADVKKMTEAVLKFVGEVKTIAKCP